MRPRLVAPPLYGIGCRFHQNGVPTYGVTLLHGAIGRYSHYQIHASGDIHTPRKIRIGRIDTGLYFARVRGFVPTGNAGCGSDYEKEEERRNC